MQLDHVTKPAGPKAPVLLAGSRLSAAIAMLLGLLSLAACLLLWYRLHMDLPERDTIPMINTVLPVLRDGLFALPFADWVHLHFGSHRIPLIRLLVVADLELGSGDNAWFYAASFTGMLALALCYMLMLLRSPLKSAIGPWFFGGIILLLVFSPAQIWNCIQPIGSSWFLSMALAAIAFSSLFGGREQLSAAATILAFVACALASFANFSGVIALLLLPVAVYLRRPGRLVLLSAMLSLGWTALYLQGLSPIDFVNAEGVRADGAATQGTWWTRVFRTGLDFSQHTLSFLSAPFSAQFQGSAALVALCSMALLVSHWARLMFRPGERRALDNWTGFTLAMATVCLGIGMAIYFGRQGLPDLPPPPRYRSVQLIYWLSISGLLLASCARSYRALLAARLACLCIAAAYLSFGSERMTSIVQSSQLAAQNTAAGVLGARPVEFLKPPWLPPPPVRLSTYHELLVEMNRSYAYMRGRLNSLELEPAAASCQHELELHRGKSWQQGLVRARLAFAGGAYRSTRWLYLLDDGAVVAAFYPDYADAERQLEILGNTHQHWHGFLGEGLASKSRAQDLTLVSQGPGGALHSCRLPALAIRGGP